MAVSDWLAAQRLTVAQIAALECVRDTEQFEDFYRDGYSRATRKLHSALWFKAADKVTDSLIKRGLVANLDGTPEHGYWQLTDAGQAALSGVEG